MLTGNFKIHKEHVYDADSIEILKAAALYGANGAGKSNLVRAVNYLKTAIEKGKITGLPIKHKSSSEWLKKPSSFELEFATNRSIFSYGLKIDHSTILEEWLVKVHPSGDDEIIFQRNVADKEQSLILNERYLKSEQDRVRRDLFAKELVSVDNLFLSFAANLKENKITEISETYQWINDKLVIIFPNSRPASLVSKFIFQKKFHAFSNQLLRSFDTGVKRIDTETIPLEQFFGEDDKGTAKVIIDRLNAGESPIMVYSPFEDVVAMKEEDKPVVKRLYTLHEGDEGQEVKFELREESDGTQRLLEFVPALYAALFESGVVIIDEIDQSIHPALLRSLVTKLMNERKMNGQLIFTTHESNLLDLDIFRQDEIWFSEKKSTGETKLYSMSDFKPRYDLDIRKGYLNGRFSAIPFLGNLTELKWDKYAEEEPVI
jgi:AAA15 family ATPase/GTPase